MTPIIRWFARHVSKPLDHMYARIDDDATEITPERTARPVGARRPDRRLKRAA